MRGEPSIVHPAGRATAQKLRSKEDAADYCHFPDPTRPVVVSESDQMRREPPAPYSP